VSSYSETEHAEKLLSPQELVRELSLGRTTVYALLSSGELPSLKIGRLRRVRRSDLIDFIEARREKTGA